MMFDLAPAKQLDQEPTSAGTEREIHLGRYGWTRGRKFHLRPELVSSLFCPGLEAPVSRHITSINFKQGESTIRIH
ncbi:hypothetical protein CEP52_005084 [Fusarium oligoseptatum]|uniref:Uncharacterized protein n=1 Tax=Fusarium oligoseptatum TaxID=2604345 RepID=A0A428U0C3_9HYPO|nr:hypothetical protein CEP52_005084 [Fusarium oligoseptatum]